MICLQNSRIGADLGRLGRDVRDEARGDARPVHGREQRRKRAVGAGLVFAGLRGKGLDRLLGDLVREDVGVEVDVFHEYAFLPRRHGDTESKQDEKTLDI